MLPVRRFALTFLDAQLEAGYQEMVLPVMTRFNKYFYYANIVSVLYSLIVTIASNSDNEPVTLWGAGFLLVVLAFLVAGALGSHFWKRQHNELSLAITFLLLLFVFMGFNRRFRSLVSAREHFLLYSDAGTSQVAYLVGMHVLRSASQTTFVSKAIHVAFFSLFGCVFMDSGALLPFSAVVTHYVLLTALGLFLCYQSEAVLRFLYFERLQLEHQKQLQEQVLACQEAPIAVFAYSAANHRVDVQYANRPFLRFLEADNESQAREGLRHIILEDGAQSSPVVAKSRSQAKQR